MNGFSAFPLIRTDLVISMGKACRPAYYIQKFGLRTFSSPFDWMDAWPLSCMTDYFRSGFDSFFQSYEVDPSDNGKHWKVKDTKTGMISLHYFPKENNQTVSDTHPAFIEMMTRRFFNLKSRISKAETVCFVGNREESKEERKRFLLEMDELFPGHTFLLYNINDSAEKIPETVFVKENLILHDVYFDDSHPLGSEKSVNPDFWLGNEAEWRRHLCSFLLNPQNGDEPSAAAPCGSIDKCVGCGACVRSCPRNAVRMECSDEGFMLPVIDSNACDACGKCRSQCPACNASPQKARTPRCFAASSPIDAFSMLAEKFINEGGIVCGAAGAPGGNFRHIAAESAGELKRIAFPESPRSDIGTVLTTVKSLLEAEVPVLFSGTPCQTAALYAFLGCDYRHLLTVDMPCHGAPSPSIWKRYLDEKFGLSHINNITFQYKLTGSPEESFTVELRDGTKYRGSADSDPYCRALKHGLPIRKSCTKCTYTGFPRRSDLTIGFPEKNSTAADTDNGTCVSIILENSLQGTLLLDSIKKNFNEINEITKDEAAGQNPFLTHCIEHPHRGLFFNVASRQTVSDALAFFYGDRSECKILSGWFAKDYGAQLTSYALQELVVRLGHSARIINLMPEDFRRKYKGSCLEKFALDYLSLTGEIRRERLHELNESTTVFITASDQACRSTPRGPDSTYAEQLSFADTSKKRIALSVSFDTDTFADNDPRLRFFRDGLSTFAGVSFQEDPPLDLCGKLGIPAERLIDPVFTIDAEKWHLMAESSPSANAADGILYYSLRINNEEPAAVPEELAKHFGYQLNTRRFTSSRMPGEWLDLIRRADFVVTDSFYAACFAVIFHREFLFLNTPSAQTARARGLLGVLGLENRMIDENGVPSAIELAAEPVDWQKIDAIIDREQSRLLKWLEEKLSDAPHGLSAGNEARSMNDSSRPGVTPQSDSFPEGLRAGPADGPLARTAGLTTEISGSEIEGMANRSRQRRSNLLMAYPPLQVGSEPELSVLITFCNQKEYVSDCLDSVAAQKTSFPIEVLVAVDGREDGTTALLESYAARCPFLRMRIFKVDSDKSLLPMSRASRNRLFLLERAKGSYFVVLDGDDLYCGTRFFEEAVRFLRKHDGHIGYACGLYTYDHTSKSIAEQWYSFKECSFTLKSYIDKICFIHTSCFVFKNIFIDKKVEFFDHNFFDDMFITHFMLRYGKGYYSGNYYFYYRININSTHNSLEKTTKNLVEISTYMKIFQMTRSRKPLVTVAGFVRQILDTANFSFKEDIRTAILLQKRPLARSLAALPDMDENAAKDTLRKLGRFADFWLSRKKSNCIGLIPSEITEGSCTWKFHQPTDKPAVLVVANIIPFPNSSGGSQYLCNALLPLHKYYDIHLLLSGDNYAYNFITNNIDDYKHYFASVTLASYEKPPVDFSKRILFYAKRILMNLPFIDTYNYSDNIIQSAYRLTREYNIQLIDCQTTHFGYLKLFFPKIPALLTSQNIETELHSFTILEKEGWKHRLESFVSRCSGYNARRAEIENLWGFEAMSFISRADLDKVTGKTAKSHIPPSFTVHDRAAGADGTFRIIWLGGFWWKPNEEGMRWFSESIFPLLRDSLEKLDIRLDIIGAYPSQPIRNMHDGKRVFVHGFVDDIEPYFERADLSIAPILSGGGIRIKIVESLSWGIPVLSTSKGCEGIGLDPGSEICIEDTAEKFAERIMELAGNPALCRKLSENGKKFVAEHFNPEEAVKRKKAIYDDLIKGRLKNSGRFFLMPQLLKTYLLMQGQKPIAAEDFTSRLDALAKNH